MGIKYRKPLHEQQHDVGVSRITIPLSWQEDSRIQDGLIFTVPPDLLRLVFSQNRTQSDLPAKVQHETELSCAINPMKDDVGVWKGRILSYPYLRPREPLRIDAAGAAVLGKTPLQAEHLARIGEQRLATFDVPLRGYLGWLLTQRTFLEEHDELLHRHREKIHLHGFPKPVHATTSTSTVNPDESDWLSELRRFFERWRLQTLEALICRCPSRHNFPIIERQHAQVQHMEKAHFLCLTSIQDLEEE